MKNSFDMAIIGAGVVGLAILRRFSMAGLRCIMLEKSTDILSGASKGNSALLHTGFDASPDSLEVRCMQAGYSEYLEIKDKLNLPLLKTSALVVAWTEEECAKLDGIVAKAHANGVTDVKRLGQKQTQTREPNLNARALASVVVPGEHVIDPWSAPLAYAYQAIAHGAEIRRNAEVTSAYFSNDQWHLKSKSGDVSARIVINAAGLFGDQVEAMVRPSPFTIRPRKGQFVVFDKPAFELTNAIILPVPTPRTKGVVLFPTIFGNLAIGPTAEETDERENASCDQKTLNELKSRAISMVPKLADVGVNAIYAGLRPATQIQDYVIEALAKQNWITVAGIRSTGLTGSLGIAQHVEQLYSSHFGKLPKQKSKVIWTPVPNLAEHLPRPFQSGSEIICHCEWVTKSEIISALSSQLPAQDLAGLKRRTRAMMGRCQGFNCGATVSSMLQEAKNGKM